MGEERERGDGSVCVCKRDSVGDGRGERESRGWGRESRWWESERERGNGNVCKRDKVGDGRECDSVRESRWW